MAKSDNGELNRSISAGNSNDPNNSFIKKVGKRVSGLFPSSLSKWFSPGEGKIRQRDSSDEEDQDEDPMQIQPPPKKRAKLPSDVDFTSTNSFSLTSTHTSTPLINSRNEFRHLHQPGSSASGYVRHASSVTAVNGDDKSDSGESTSGYSSAHIPQQKESSFNSDRGNVTNQQPNKSSLNKSPNTSLNSSRSLFSDQSLNPQRKCMSARRPSFNASTFGSPTFIDRTLSTNRAVNSPFYGGRTTYGGASAYRRNRIIFPRNEASNVAVKNSVQIKPVNESTDNNNTANLSKTARRILDALEHFSTPVTDAKKIPPVRTPNLRPSEQANKQKSVKSPYCREVRSAPKKELLVPDLLQMKMKKRLQDSTEQVRQVATTSKSVLNTEYSIRTDDSSSSKSQKHTNKIKTKVAAVREKRDCLDGVAQEVKLPEVQLPITSLPKFDFTLPPPPSATVTSKPAESRIKKPIELIKPLPATQPTTLSSSLQFEFASPIVVSETPKSVSSINSFKFSEPLNAKLATDPAIIFKTPARNTAPRRKETSKNNGQNTDLGFSLQPAPQLSTGSVMDMLGKPEKKKDDLMSKFMDPTLWECSSCMVRNLPTDTRCKACEVLKTPPKETDKSKIVGFGDKFKMSSNEWECSECMVRNSGANTKCVACTSQRPNTAPKLTENAKAPASSVQSFSGFGDKFKPASGSWECSSCLLRNKPEDIKCAACEAAKPGAKTETKSTLVMPADDKNKSGFADLIKKQQASGWECDSCMVRNDTARTKCSCCGAAKPGTQPDLNFGGKSQTTPQFKFGIDKADSIAPKDYSGVKSEPQFKFGIDKAKSSDTSVPTFSFGTTKPDVAPTFTFGVPATSKPEEKKSESQVTDLTDSPPPKKKDENNFSYGTPAQTSVSTSRPQVSSATMFSFTSTSPANKMPISFGGTEIPFSYSTTKIASTSTTTLTQSTSVKPSFTFGAVSTTGPATNTTALTTNTNSKPTDSSATFSGSSLFGNASTTAAISFGATKPTTTASATAAPVTTSSFSFGIKSNSTPAPTATFASGNSLPVPQFNFGAGGLPFNPKPETTPATGTVATTTSSTTLSFGSASGSSAKRSADGFSGGTPAKISSDGFGNGTTAFAAPSSQQFTFNSSSGFGNNNKTEVKLFSFGGGEMPTKAPAFSFTPNESSSAAPLSKAPAFNFGASSSAGSGDKITTAASSSGFGKATSSPSAGLFGFNTPNNDKPAPVFGSNGSAGSSVFGTPTQAKPQNGGFNFGAPSATPTFNFGASTTPAAPPARPAPPVFGFGSSQAGTGSAAPAASGVFSFGSPVQPQPSFTPDIKPNFNFTGGAPTSFTAQQSGPSSSTMQGRKIRKAVRRAPR